MKSNQNDASVRFLYGNPAGLFLLKLILALRVPALLGALLRTPLSRFYIKSFIKKNHIDMQGFENTEFKSFNDFFTRKKEIQFDANPASLISPADGMLSVYEITKESSFHIKGFDYKTTDLIPDSGSAELFTGGTCLVFRLRPTDYHRYCYIDDGTIEENHFIQGSLYSVQDAACRRFKVYTLNRRSWTIMRTKHFGAVAQIEVGAFSVGGIINHDENCRIRRGDEKGYFDLHGSTIVILLQKEKAKLFSAVKEAARLGQEFPVKAGSAIGKNDF